MKYNFDYSLEKDLVLRETRGISFEDITEAIEKGNLAADIKNPHKMKYPNQRMFAVKIKNYIYAVPYVEDKVREVIFLKTAYPSRKLTKTYLKKEQ